VLSGGLIVKLFYNRGCILSGVVVSGRQSDMVKNVLAIYATTGNRTQGVNHAIRARLLVGYVLPLHHRRVVVRWD
jgi:hypothetical protein